MRAAVTFFETAGVAVPDSPPRAAADSEVAGTPWSRATSAGLALGLIAAAAAGYARWQLALAVVPWDSKNHFYPMFRFLGDALRRGALPLWNPYHFSGYPAVADPQSLIFTPSMALLAFVVPDASMPAFDAMVLAHLVAGGFGVLGLARHWRWHPAAALLAALVFMFGGSAASRLQHTGMIISYAFFPLALWSLLAALDRRSLRLAVVAGAMAGLMALGRDQVAYLLCLSLGALALRHALTGRRAARGGGLAILALAAAVTVAVVIVPALLTMQFLQSSNRPAIAYGMALEGSLDPVNLLTLVAGNVFGSLDAVYDYWGPGAATPAGNDWTDRTIDYLFAGTLPLVLLAWHGLAAGRAYERGVRPALLLFTAALLYAFGRHTPVFAAAFDWIPGVSLYRRPADATFVANIALALLAGFLLHRFVMAGTPRRPSIPVLAAAALLFAAAAWLVGSGLGFAWRTGNIGAALVTLVASLLLAGGVGLLLHVAHRRGRRGLVAYLLVAATGGQLVWLNTASPLNAEPASTYSAYDGLYPDQVRGLAVLLPELAARAALGEHPRIEILGLDGSWQNAAMVMKLENTVGYNPLRMATYERALGVAESSNDPNLRSFPETFRGYNSHLAKLLGLDYLVLDRPIAELPRHIPRPHGSLLFAGDHFFVYRLDNTCAPRAYLASRVVVADEAFPAFDVPREALLGRSEAALLGNASLLTAVEASAPSRVTVAVEGDDAVAIDVEAATAGVLVLHDLAYPGWEVRVDGVRKPLLHANLLFRGVEVAPGRHHVEFSFHPFAPGNLVAAAQGLLRKGSR